MAREYFTAVNLDVPIIREINELPMSEFSEYFVRRYLAQSSEVSNRVLAWVSVARLIVDDDFHKLFMAYKDFITVDMHLTLLIKMMEFAINLLTKDIFVVNPGETHQMWDARLALMDLILLLVDFDLNFMVMMMFMLVVLFSRALVPLWGSCFF